MKLVGVDLSTQPRRTGICVLDNGGVRVGLCEGPASTHIETMLGYCEDARVVAIDVPFGWPKPFVEAMKWYEVGTPLDHLREEYRLRKTDLWIRKNVPPLNPLSVSTDKLGSTTIVGTNLLYALGSRGFELSPRTSRTYPAVIEVYPAASLTIWGLHSGERGTMLEEPRERFGLQLTDQTTELVTRNRSLLRRARLRAHRQSVHGRLYR